MRHLLSLLLILVLLSSCINKNLTNYNTNKIARFITNNIKYPEDAVSQNLSSLVLVKIVFKKKGDIDSIFSLNSPESEFTNAVISVLKKSNKTLYEGIHKIPLLIPVYFLHGDANDTIRINYPKDFRPENMKEYPFKCIYFKPIIIVSRSNIKIQ